MKNERKFSVIVPTHNRIRMLEKCLISLLDQNYSNDCYEIIVVDNSLSGSAQDLVNEMVNSSEREILYFHEKNPGLVYARHAGARAAKYDIIAFTDDDGILDKDWLKEINNVFEINDKVSAVAGRIKILWDKEPPEWVKDFESLLGRNEYGSDVFFGCEDIYICGGNFIIRKDVLFKLKGFNPGQLGEYLAGDSETGLCYKLWENNHLIGWAPDAIMFHCQMVKKHATIKDICRRYFNNGMATAFRFVFTDKSRGGVIFKKVVFSIRRILYHAKNYLFPKSNRLNHFFGIFFELGFLFYVFRSIFDFKLKKVVKLRDWEL